MRQHLGIPTKRVFLVGYYFSEKFKMGNSYCTKQISIVYLTFKNTSQLNKPHFILPRAVLKNLIHSELLKNFSYRREILTFQLEREKLFRFSHIAYAYVVKTE